MINFSFIIPHYNLNPSLLRRCLDSIPHRDDVQIIVVDDHTPSLYDNNDSLIDEHRVAFVGYSEDCTEILFLEKNGGPGIARNEALKIAKGEWVFFADADDYFERENLEKFLNILRTKDLDEYDSLYLGINYIDEQGFLFKDLYGRKLGSIEKIQDKKRFLEDQHQSWRKVVKRDFLIAKKLNFSEWRYCEDQSFSIRILLESQKIGIYSVPIYNYIRRESSLSHNIELKDLEFAIQDTFCINKKLLKQKDSPRLIVTPYILYNIYKKTKGKYYWFTLLEFVTFGFRTTLSDYKNVCAQRGVSNNIFHQIIDPIRVRLGEVKQRCLKG